jgi:3-methyladenine DNA glycosylase/8-oxoguanine DNA glycosylase
MEASIVIVSGHSVFADGVALRLRQHSATVPLATVDPRQPDAEARIVAARPSAVLLDNSLPDVARLCHLDDLLRSLPGLRVIRLDPAVQSVEVITSQRHPVADVYDLAAVIGI